MFLVRGALSGVASIAAERSGFSDMALRPRAVAKPDDSAVLSETFLVRLLL